MGISRLHSTATPYSSGHLSEIGVVQSADTLLMAHLDVQPYKLQRFANDDWRFSVIAFEPAMATPTGVSGVATASNTDSDNTGDANAYNPKNDRYVISAVGSDESRPSAAVSLVNDLALARNKNTITWPAVTDAERYVIYKSHEGGAYGFIGSAEGLSFVDDNIAPDYSRGPRQTANPFDSVNNYPSTVNLYEQRSVWARTRNNPNAIWLSRSGSLENLDESFPIVASDGVSFALVAGQVNAVNQLASLDTLLALSSDSIFDIRSDDGNALSALNVRSRRTIGRGSSRLFPLVIDNMVFFQPSIGSYVHAASYNFTQDGFRPTDVSIFSPHFFDGHSIVDWAYMAEPHSLVWAVRDDGKLLCFAWEQEQQVWGWTLCETAGVIKSVCVIPENSEDRLYMIVERQVGGATKRFVERMASMSEPPIEEQCFTDCSISGELETPGRVFTGFNHLEGETLVGLADGTPVEGLVVEDGKITVPEIIGDVTFGTFGLPYTNIVETLPLAFNTQGGGWINQKRQNTGRAVVRLRDSRQYMAGVRKLAASNEPKLYLQKARSTEGFGAHDDYLNGDYEITTESYTSGEITLYLKQDLPLPFNLLTVFLEPNVSD